MQASLFDDHQEPQILQQCNNIQRLNAKQKEFFQVLLNPDHYCTTRMNNNAESVYIIYTGQQEPVKMFSRETGDAIKVLFKKHRNIYYTLNLTKVRMADGRSFIKKAYKKLRHGKREAT